MPTTNDPTVLNIDLHEPDQPVDQPSGFLQEAPQSMRMTLVSLSVLVVPPKRRFELEADGLIIIYNGDRTLSALLFGLCQVWVSLSRGHWSSLSLQRMIAVFLPSVLPAFIPLQ